jgi:hypothetical protein
MRLAVHMCTREPWIAANLDPAYEAGLLLHTLHDNLPYQSQSQPSRIISDDVSPCSIDCILSRRMNFPVRLTKREGVRVNTPANDEGS